MISMVTFSLNLRQPGRVVSCVCRTADSRVIENLSVSFEDSDQDGGEELLFQHREISYHSSSLSLLFEEALCLAHESGSVFQPLSSAALMVMQPQNTSRRFSSPRHCHLLLRKCIRVSAQAQSVKINFFCCLSKESEHSRGCHKYKLFFS